MIHYVVQRKHCYTITTFLEDWGRELDGSVRMVFYDRLRRRLRYPRGAWIFSDLDRLDPETAARAGRIRERLARSRRVLNDPVRSLQRVALLRTLRERGINSFDVHRLADGAEPRLPVFLRRERGHDGPTTDLLTTPEEYAAAVDALESRDGMLAVEFVDTARDGVYHKYSAFRVGDRIVPRHLFFSRDWVVKEADLHDAPRLEQELAYVRENPHAERVREVFDLAGIEYGRIDYAMHDGRMEVFEINTNPMIASAVARKITARREVNELASRQVMDALRATAN